MQALNATDGALEDIGATDIDVWPGSILALEAELYEVSLSEKSDADGWVYCTHTSLPGSIPLPTSTS